MASSRQTKAFRESLLLTKGEQAEKKRSSLPPVLRKIVNVRKALADPLKDFITRIPGGREAVYKVLLQCHDDPQAQQIIDAWDEILKDRDAHVGSTNVNDVAERAEISPREFVGVVSRCFWDFGIMSAKGIFAAHYPRMMDASMRRAMQNDATDERAIHFKATGHLPTSKGIQIGIKNTNIEREAERGEVDFALNARKVVRDLPPEG